MGTSKKRIEHLTGYCPTQEKEENVEQTYLEVTTLGSLHPQYIDGGLFCPYVSIKGGKCDLFANCPVKNGTESINGKRKNDAVQDKINEFIDRAKGLEAKRNEKSKQSSIGLIYAIGGEDFEQWRSELIMFAKLYLSGHILYKELLDVLESYKTKTLHNLSDSIGKLKAISSDPTFFEQNMSIQFKERENTTKTNSKDVFIVHGHTKLIDTVSLVVSKLGLNPIVLFKQADKGRTIISKFEDYGSQAGYAIVIYSPNDKLDNGKMRARQNVILEHGYFMGKLGREKVFVLIENDVIEKPGIEKPGDIDGVIYNPLEEGWEFKLVRELKAVGYDVSADSIL